MGPIRVEQRVGDGRPRLRRAVAKEEPSRLSLSVALGALPGQCNGRVDDPVGCERECQPPWNKGEATKQPVLEALRDELPSEMDRHQDDDDQQDRGGDVEDGLTPRNKLGGLG